MTNYRKITSFKDVQEFQSYLQEEQIQIPLSEEISSLPLSLAKPLTVCGKTAGNRWSILPMEGWDCQDNGAPSELTRRRWLRFATSGAKLLYGTEACAVMHAGKSNPQQLMIDDNTVGDFKKILADMRTAHREKFGNSDDFIVGLQLTHSGRFAHPNQAMKREARTAYAHPLLDQKFGCGPENVVSDAETEEIIRHFIHAAELARKAGFDFVDIKSAHGYLAHEFLSAVHRPGKFGGSFENRTRFFREIAGGIREKCPDLPLSARLSLFDIKPFLKGEDGVGHPMEWQGEYPYAFGGDGSGMQMDPDLTEPTKFIKMMQSEFGIDLICATIGSPYYNVHMQRPAYYPVCDGYLPPENPLYNVSRHLKAVKRIKELCPGIRVVGSGYTCLQEFLPYVADYVLRHDEADFIGIGRMVLCYPEMCADTLAGHTLDRKRICRTLGDCTNAPRHGLVSGCYPLDTYYKQMPEAQKLAKFKKNK